jgi:hypothetical protein
MEVKNTDLKEAMEQIEKMSSWIVRHLSKNA